MELDGPAETIGELAERFADLAERDPNMPVRVLHRERDNDYERGDRGPWWALASIEATGERGGFLYLVAPDPGEVDNIKYAEDVTGAFDQRRARERKATQQRLAEAEAAAEAARVELKRLR